MSYVRFLSTHTRFLAFGFALAFFSSFGQTFFISLFGDEIRGDFALSHGAFGLCYSLATLASSLTIIWLGKKIDSVDLRLFSAVLCGGLVVACLGMWWAPVVPVLAVSLFALRLTGQGLLSHTAMTSMARYFDEERGKAMSVAGLGFPAGEAVLPFAAVLVMAELGWRSTWLLIAGLLASLVIPLVTWLLRGHGERHRAHVERLAADEAAEENGDQGTRQRQWTRAEVLRDPRLYLVLPAVIAPGFIVTGLFFHQVHLVETKGWSLAFFASCFAVFAGAQLPSGLVAGPLVDRLGARRMMPFILLPLAASLAVLASGRHWVVAPGFMILAGITSGLTGPVVGSLWAELYGVRHIGAIRAMITAVLVFGTAGSPVAMGWLIDGGVTMEAIAMMCAAYALLASALAWPAVRSPSTRA